MRLLLPLGVSVFVNWMAVHFPLSWLFNEPAPPQPEQDLAGTELACWENFLHNNKNSMKYLSCMCLINLEPHLSQSFTFRQEVVQQPADIRAEKVSKSKYQCRV